MIGTKQVNRVSGECFPISLQSLRLDTVLDFDLFIKVDGEYVLYRASNLPFSKKTQRWLLDREVKGLYVSTDGRRGYHKYIESHIRDILHDESIPQKDRTNILYDTTKLLVKDVLDKPTDRTNVERTMSMVEATVMHSLMNRNALQNLIRVMAFDYTIYTHSVNVCTFAIALAQFSGIEDATELGRLGIGALLHDVGKTKVPEGILKKRGPLTRQEKMIVDKHPQWGFEIVLESDVIPHESHYPVLQHHERENGTGYPHRLRSDEIHRFGKIVAIADVFDAMTTQRVYRHAVDSFPALKEMYEDKGAFDRKLLDKFTRMMGHQGA